jgi:hypothetical protein
LCSVNVYTKITRKVDYRMFTCHKTKEVTKFNKTGPLFTSGSKKVEGTAPASRSYKCFDGRNKAKPDSKRSMSPTVKGQKGKKSTHLRFLKSLMFSWWDGYFI